MVCLHRDHLAILYGNHGDAEGFHHGIMRNDDDGGFLFAIVVVEQVQDFAAGFGIKAAGGFICQDEVRMVSDGASNGNALLLSPGESAYALANHVFQADFFQRL